MKSWPNVKLGSFLIISIHQYTIQIWQTLKFDKVTVSLNIINFPSFKNVMSYLVVICPYIHILSSSRMKLCQVEVGSKYLSVDHLASGWGNIMIIICHSWHEKLIKIVIMSIWNQFEHFSSWCRFEHCHSRKLYLVIICTNSQEKRLTSLPRYP